jgi:hypothetical protein
MRIANDEREAGNRGREKLRLRLRSREDRGEAEAEGKVKAKGGEGEESRGLYPGRAQRGTVPLRRFRREG